jgi:hypothetical protein
MEKAFVTGLAAARAICKRAGRETIDIIALPEPTMLQKAARRLS